MKQRKRGAMTCGLGNSLQKRRRELGKSQHSLAKELGYSSAQYISNIERDIAPIPTEKLGAFVRVYSLNQNNFEKALLRQIKKNIRKHF